MGGLGEMAKQGIRRAFERKEAVMVELARVMGDMEVLVVQLVVVTGVVMMQVLEVATEVVVELPFMVVEGDMVVQVAVDIIHMGGRRFVVF